MEDRLNENITALISRCLEGSASVNERTDLEKWIKLSQENLAYYRQIKNIWELSSQPIKYSGEQLKKTLAGILNDKSRGKSDRVVWSILQKAAAVLLLPLIVGSFYLGKHYSEGLMKTSDQVVYNEVFASYGTRSAISLADGSRVWLNSGSSLKYPDRFTGKKREVYLNGEAYFEVESDISNPFFVHIGTMVVKTTGTKFNVLATVDESVAEVTLVSGKVAVSCSKKSGLKGINKHLNPEDHMEYDPLTGKCNITRGDTYQYIAWKDGKLIFRNESFPEVMDKLSRFYNVEIELHGEKLKDYRYRATFEEESFSEILKLLRLTSPIEYREIERHPLPDGTFPKRKVIIMARN